MIKKEGKQGRKNVNDSEGAEAFREKIRFM